jgi:hypothetical protein
LTKIPLAVGSSDGEDPAVLNCQSDPTVVARIRVFYTFGLDLVDYLEVTSESVDALQEMRAAGGLLKLYEASLAAEQNYGPQADRIADEAKEAVSKEGKAVWSDTFLKSRSAWLTPYPEVFNIGAEQLRVAGSVGLLDGSLSSWVFDTIRAYLTPDGVVVMTVSFRRESEQDLNDAIRDLRALRQHARKVFDSHAQFIVKEGSPVRLMLAGCGFVPGARPNPEKVRSHRTMFVHSMNCQSRRMCDAHRLRNTAAVAGLMNLAKWYPTYHSEYLHRLALKEFGYRSNELYLVDRDTTLCMQEGFWDANNPLHLYMGNVLQAVEYHVGLQALMRGQLQYARRLYSTSATESSSAEAVDGVRRSRAILSGAYESLNYSVLVLHGFTRRLLRALDEESEISAILNDVERRVENVSDSVSLQASVSTSNVTARLQEFGNGINRRVLWVTLAAMLTSALALVVTIFK